MTRQKKHLENNLQDFYKEAPIGLCSLDTNLRYIHINDWLAALNGETVEAHLRRTIREVLPDVAAGVERQLRKVIETGEPLFDGTVEAETPAHPGVVRNFQHSYYPNRSKDGRIVGVSCVVEDITERKRAEGEKSRLEEQLRLSQKLEAVGQLAGGIAHDFKNLLTVITGYSQLLLSNLGPDDPSHLEIEQIYQAGARAATLTRQQHAFSRKQVLTPKVLDLNAGVAGMEKLLQRLIGESIKLVTYPGPSPALVKADPNQIEQVIMNLAINARDAMSRGGQLTIETKDVELDEAYVRLHPPTPPGSYVLLAVSDTGAGMDAETQARIFEPFFTTKEMGVGTGLGLATVYGIVKQSGGYIWVYSELGKGSTFKIYLPRVTQAAECVQPGQGSAQPGRGSETNLLVEDEEMVRTLAGAILQRNGYTVLQAQNGAEALRVSKECTGSIHLLLTDTVMPEINGGELAERLVGLRPEIKVLYMSGYTDKVIAQHGVLDPGTNFLEKPFTPNGLADKVREVLNTNR